MVIRDISVVFFRLLFLALTCVLYLYDVNFTMIFLGRLSPSSLAKGDGTRRFSIHPRFPIRCGLSILTRVMDCFSGLRINLLMLFSVSETPLISIQFRREYCSKPSICYSKALFTIGARALYNQNCLALHKLLHTLHELSHSLHGFFVVASSLLEIVDMLSIQTQPNPIQIIVTQRTNIRTNV